MLRLGFFGIFDKMRGFEVLFWCAPENTTFLVVSELPVEERKDIQKSAMCAFVLFGGFWCVRFSTLFVFFVVFVCFSSGFLFPIF